MTRFVLGYAIRRQKTTSPFRFRRATRTQSTTAGSRCCRKIQHVLQISNNGQHGQVGGPMLLQVGRIAIGGAVYTGTNGRMQIMMGLQHDGIFANTFD